MWAPEVYWERKTKELKNVYRSFLRGRRQSCSACKERGATVPCCIESCTEVFHYLCLESAQCTVRMSAHMAFCPSHHKVAAARPGEPLVAAGLIGLIMARQVVRFPPDSDDESFMVDSLDLWDTPHASHTRLRRYETEIIFSRLWLVGSVVPEPADVLVSFRQGCLMKAGEQMSVRIGLRFVTKSVADFVIARHARAQKAGADMDPNVPASRCRRAPLFLLRNFRHAPVLPAGRIRQVSPMLPSSRDRSTMAQNKSPGAASGSRTPAMGDAVRDRKRANVESLWDKLGQQNAKRQKMMANSADGTMVTGVGSLPKVSGKAVAVDAATTHPVYQMDPAAPDAHVVVDTTAAAHEEGVAHAAVPVEVGVAAPDAHLALSMAPDDAARTKRVEAPVEVGVAAEDVNVLGDTAAALEVAATGRVEALVEGGVVLPDAHVRTSTAAAVHAAPVAHVAEPVEVGTAAPAAHLVVETAGLAHTADGGGVEAPIQVGVAAVDEHVLFNTAATTTAPAGGAGALGNNGMPPGARMNRPSVGDARVKKEGGAGSGAVVAVDDDAVIIISDSD